MSEVTRFEAEVDCDYGEYENGVFRELTVIVDIAVRLSELGIETEIIAEATKLTLNDINSLKTNRKLIS